MHTVKTPVFVTGLALLALVPALAARAQDKTDLWTVASSMNSPRSAYTTALLPGGKVLAVGGYTNGTYTNRAELYDPANDTWKPTGSMLQARGLHTMTVLLTGDVLVAGGWGTAIANRGILDRVEFYDPDAGTWSATGSMTVPRYLHTAVRLLDGRVLLAGGCSKRSCTAVESSAELYDPATGTCSRTGSMSIQRQGATATLLANGRVLVAGGSSANSGNRLASAEVYDPVTGSWTGTGSMATARYGHGATRLSSWRLGGPTRTSRSLVLVAGGVDPTSLLASAEIYDTFSGLWTRTTSMEMGRASHTQTLLANGQILVAGGGPGDKNTYLTSAELYDPASTKWLPAGDMTTPRVGHVATLLLNGQVLVAGGHITSETYGASASAELYTPPLAGR